MKLVNLIGSHLPGWDATGSARGEGHGDDAALLGVEMQSTSQMMSKGAGARRSGRSFRARTALPQEIQYEVPLNFSGGPVRAEGPHGPLRIPVAEGLKPGERGTMWLGPNTYLVLVPDGAGPGDLVAGQGPNGEVMEVKVPPRKQPGDHFEVVPPALMIEVPKGAGPGDFVDFATLEGVEVTVAVPTGVEPGQYFAAVGHVG